MNKGNYFRFLFTVTLFFSFVVFSSTFKAETKIIKEKTFKVKPGGELKVKADGADVLLKSWDKEELNVKILSKRRKVGHIKIKFKQDNNKVYIEVKTSRNSFFHLFEKSSVGYKIIVYLPSKFNPEIKTSGGDIIIKNLNGTENLKTSGGDIVAENCSGEMDAKTSGGDVVIKNHAGKVYVATSGGDVKVSNSKGAVSAFTSGGDVVINASNAPIEAKTSGGDVVLKYKGLNQGISLGTSGGDISMKLPNEIKANVDLKSIGGELKLDFPNSKLEKLTKSTFNGTFNGGGKEIKAYTSGGDIIVTGISAK